jgi:hypothetical protein
VSSDATLWFIAWRFLESEIMRASCRLAIAGFVGFVLVARVQAQNPFSLFTQFSATMSGGPMKMEPMRIYRSGELFRADYDDQYRITSLEKRTTWIVMRKQCSKLAMPDGASYPFSAYNDSFKMERIPIEGKETIDGHSCQLEQVIFTPNDGRPIVIKMKLWKAKDLDGFPIQVEVEPTARPKFTIHYANVSLQPPDPKLFRRPANCTVGPHEGQKGTVKLPSATPKPPQKPPPGF